MNRVSNTSILETGIQQCFNDDCPSNNTHHCRIMGSQNQILLPWFSSWGLCRLSSLDITHLLKLYTTLDTELHMYIHKPQNERTRKLRCKGTYYSIHLISSPEQRLKNLAQPHWPAHGLTQPNPK